MADRNFVAVLIATAAGLLIWAAHFLIVYGSTALACTPGIGDGEEPGSNVVPTTVGMVTAVAVFAVLSALVLARRSPDLNPVRADEGSLQRFLRWMAGAIAALSLVAITLEGVTVIFVPPCV